MSSRMFLAVLMIVAVLAPLSAAAQNKCMDPLIEGRGLYEQMDYEQALTKFQAVLEQPECTDPQLVEAHMFTARIYVVLEQSAKAREHMLAALCIDPLLYLDPEKDSPKFQQALNDARDEIKRGAYRCPGDDGNADNGGGRNGKRIAAWITLGVGGVGVAGAGTMFALAVGEDEQQKQAADDGDQEAHDEHWKNTQTYSTAAYVAGGVAVVSLGTSIALFIVSRDRHALLEGPGFELSAAPLLAPQRQGIVFNLRF